MAILGSNVPRVQVSLLPSFLVGSKLDDAVNGHTVRACFTVAVRQVKHFARTALLFPQFCIAVDVCESVSAEMRLSLYHKNGRLYPRTAVNIVSNFVFQSVSKAHVGVKHHFFVVGIGAHVRSAPLLDNALAVRLCDIFLSPSFEQD